MPRILLADDDAELCEMLSEYLGAEGFAVDAVHDGEAALVQARAQDYDLLVLDVMMPRKNGFDVLRELRARSQLPVLILTARGDDVDSVLGLELGADDYLAKPSNPRVLVARIRAVLRRAHGQDGDGTQRLGDLELHAGTREVLLDDRPVTVTSTEYCVLEVLVGAAGRLVAKDELSRQALGRELGRWDRSIDMHISNLRRKLGPLPDGGERIKTVRGQGYQYVRP
ncbi:MAG: response regulator [Gammaproteobacteria bacterium]